MLFNFHILINKLLIASCDLQKNFDKYIALKKNKMQEEIMNREKKLKENEELLEKELIAFEGNGSVNYQFAIKTKFLLESKGLTLSNCNSENFKKIEEHMDPKEKKGIESKCKKILNVRNFKEIKLLDEFIEKVEINVLENIRDIFKKDISEEIKKSFEKTSLGTDVCFNFLKYLLQKSLCSDSSIASLLSNLNVEPILLKVMVNLSYTKIKQIKRNI